MVQLKYPPRPRQRKYPSRRTLSLVSTAFLILATLLIYRAFYPPLPLYLVKRIPPHSSVEVSRRFYPGWWGPKLYCRIHSPLSARQTASYIENSPNLSVGTSYGFGESMSGWGLIRAGNFYDVDYAPDEIMSEGTEVHPRMIVWPEENGSTIEFYYETDFD